ncbi:MAG: prepilin peptidase [Clostridiales bacterium]|nr:prepilin peptidase [Clostridiales bacterium]
MESKKTLEYEKYPTTVQDRADTYQLRSIIVSHPILTATAASSVLTFLLLLLYVKEMDAASSLHITGIYTFLLPIAAIDFKHKIIPNWRLPVFVAIALLYGSHRVSVGVSEISDILLDMAAGMLLGGGVFMLATLMTRGGVGMGDVKLFAVLGLALGFFQTFLLIMYTLLCATAFGLVMIMCGKASVKTRIAVAPFVLLSTVLIAFIG